MVVPVGVIAVPQFSVFRKMRHLMQTNIPKVKFIKGHIGWGRGSQKKANLLKAVSVTVFVLP